MDPSAPPAPFIRIGPERPQLPVVLSVPHAGRAYSPALLRSARLPRMKLERLEDRLVDRLVWRATQSGATALIALAPRAEIDLNRDEREIDPAMIVPPPSAAALIASPRTRGGLGLIPGRIGNAGPIWTGRIPAAELDRRIETIHRPYHQPLEAALGHARTRFGAAILLDCHSMPPRPRGEGGGGAIRPGSISRSSRFRSISARGARATKAVAPFAVARQTSRSTSRSSSVSSAACGSRAARSSSGR
jgi:N-formylglutamate amidohydrolase